MSVKIRLAKVGKSHQISYRVVAQDTRSKRDGKFLDVLGFYNPYNNPALEINKEKLTLWIQKGALPTLAVKSLIEKGKLTKRASKRKLRLAEEQAQAAQASNQPAAAPAPEAQVQQQDQKPKQQTTQAPAQTQKDKGEAEKAKVEIPQPAGE